MPFFAPSAENLGENRRRKKLTAFCQNSNTTKPARIPFLSKWLLDKSSSWRAFARDGGLAYILTNTDILYLCVHINWDGANHLFSIYGNKDGENDAKKILASAAFVLLACSALCGCKYALQRGMLDGAYISTARPAISIAARDMPLMASGEGMANLDWSDMLGGLNIQMWLAVYGTGGLAPLAVVAQADVPQGWYWDGILSLPFSVDRGNENFNGVGYQACTVIVDPSGSPFGGLITGVQPAGQPQLWVARYMAARYNFNNSKIILQYMEPLPEGITSLTALPLGMGDFLQQFAQRARNAFVVQNGPARPSGIKTGYIQGINWTRMGTNFLGTVSRFDYWKD